MTPTDTMPEAANRLVHRYYTYAGIYTLAASVIWGINTLFLLDAGLSIQEVFIANAAFSIGSVLFEIPTGVVADTIGRRASFLLSLIVLAASTLGYVALASVGAGLIAFSLVSVLMGLGFTFYSGAMEAWLVDGVRELGYDGDMDGIFANGQIVGASAMLVGTIGGGVLGQINLALPFVVRSVLLIALFFLAYLGMHDVGFEARTISIRSVPAEAATIARTGIRDGWGSRPLRMIMIAGAIQNGVFFWTWYAWQPYFLELLEADAVWVAGVVAAILALAMMAGNALVKFFSRFCGRRTTILGWAVLVFGGASIGVGWASNFVVALSFLAVSAVAMGVQMPVRQAFINNIAPSKQRATVISFDSMIGGLGAATGQAGLGVYSGREGYSVAYVAAGAIALLAAPFVLVARSMRSDADYFEGTSGSESAGCVPHGIPATASVDASDHLTDRGSP